MGAKRTQMGMQKLYNMLIRKFQRGEYWQTYICVHQCSALVDRILYLPMSEGLSVVMIQLGNVTY